MNTLPYQAEIARRMEAAGEGRIRPDAEFYHTANGYWIAWQQPQAAVMREDLPGLFRGQRGRMAGTRRLQLRLSAPIKGFQAA